MRKIIKAILPERAKQIIIAWKERELVSQIKSLPIDTMGVDLDTTPWVRLQNGLIFYGLKPSNTQTFFYQHYKNKLPDIREECIGVVSEIISRYLVPRSLPGETVYQPSRYIPLRDPLNDFQLTDTQRRALAEKFRPQNCDIFVDAGAYLGYGTMKLAQMTAPAGRIIAFESDPDILKILKRNIEENKLGNVKIIPKAVSLQSGKSTFFRKTGTVNSLDKAVLETLGYEELQEITVDVTTIDETLKELGINSVDFVNITINGFEHEALLGMQDTLRNSPSVKVTLAGWYYKNNQRICDIVKTDLEQMGFEVMAGKLGRVLAWKKDK